MWRRATGTSAPGLEVVTARTGAAATMLRGHHLGRTAFVAEAAVGSAALEMLRSSAGRTAFMMETAAVGATRRGGLVAGTAGSALMTAAFVTTSGTPAARGTTLMTAGRAGLMTAAGRTARMAAPRVALRLGLLAAAALVLLVLGKRRPARASEQDDGQG